MTGTGGTGLRTGNHALTMITPLTWWGLPWLGLQFRLTRRFPSLKGLEPFKSVYFSQWCLVRSFHFNGPPQLRERPSRPWMLWEVVYSAEADPYIESFIAGIPKQIRRLWNSSYGFPGTGSVARLTDYITAARWQSDVEYWAYPDATVRTILSGLEVVKEHAFLTVAARDGTDEDFAAAYAGFLRRRGSDL